MRSGRGGMASIEASSGSPSDRYERALGSLAAGVPGFGDGPLCAQRVVASLDRNLAIRPHDEPVSGASRHIAPATADDEQVITDQTIFDRGLDEELKDRWVVVLVDLDAGDEFHSWPPPLPSVMPPLPPLISAMVLAPNCSG